jgi:signal transduction histidine kinase
MLEKLYHWKRHIADQLRARRANLPLSWVGLADFNQDGIKLIDLSFEDSEQEIKYRKAVLVKSLVQVRAALVLGTILAAGIPIASSINIALFGLFDRSLSNNPFVHVRIFWCLVIAAAPAIYLTLTFYRDFSSYMVQLLGVLMMSASSGLFSAIAYGTDTVIVVYVFPAIIMTSVFAFFFCGLFFPYGFAVGAFSNLTFSFAIWSVDISTTIGIGINAQMIVIFLLLAMAAYQKELTSRRLFVSEARERQEIEQKHLAERELLWRQNQTDRRYIDWLRHLGSFLRHEVRQPIAQISSSTELLKLGADRNERTSSLINSVAESALHVWNLIERASQATDAEAFVRAGVPQLLDLDTLLKGVVEGFQRAYSGITFHLEELQAASISADPTLINEAIFNLLTNAASYAEEESAIHVALQVVGNVALVRVRNKGPLIEHDTDELFRPFSSTRAGPSSEHQGLGLYLVRLIAEQHGGSAHIANLDDRSGVEASIALALVSL